METYTWSKGILKNQLELWHGTDSIGSIVSENMIGSRATGSINGRQFFLIRDFLRSKFEIYDANTSEFLGAITIGLLNPKGEIVLNGKQFELEIKNFWQSYWTWKFNGNELITYQSNEFFTKESGTVQIVTACTEEIEILLLLGLLVRNQLILFVLLLIILLLIVVI
jgi:hypothetical protein